MHWYSNKVQVHRRHLYTLTEIYIFLEWTHLSRCIYMYPLFVFLMYNFSVPCATERHHFQFTSKPRAGWPFNSTFGLIVPACVSRRSPWINPIYRSKVLFKWDLVPSFVFGQSKCFKGLMLTLGPPMVSTDFTVVWFQPSSVSISILQERF